MSANTLRIHHNDNIIVALRDLEIGQIVEVGDEEIIIREQIPIKHKFALEDIQLSQVVRMYGVTVGKAIQPIKKGELISTSNIVHAAGAYQYDGSHFDWEGPDVEEFKKLHFQGYHRADGKVGTRNLWLVVPLVFCENRNIATIENEMIEQLGYGARQENAFDIAKLITMYREGKKSEELLDAEILLAPNAVRSSQVFPNVDGIRFLKHEGGCGGTREDSYALCRLIAGYIANPNVAGATILSLGCQHAQIEMMKEALGEVRGVEGKSIYFLEQQQSASERSFIAEAIKKTFVGLIDANQLKRAPASLDKLTIGLECGGSDGFSGITANPVLGAVSDRLVKLGGSTLLSEFPELNGVEQELINRCKDKDTAVKFAELMKRYSVAAEKVGSGFHMNPSPGNIKDGLITDAIKSAGAARKGGTSPVVEVLDYTEQGKLQGLKLLCTPGNDVESTTGLAGSGANIILFTTGLGTPTGNPIAPTIKVSTNTMVRNRMPDLIDFDTGSIARGESTIDQKAIELLHHIIKVANGETFTKAEQLQQFDFIPWKRGVSL